MMILLLAGCDAVQPQDSSLLVVEAFVTVDQPMPEITLRKTGSISDLYLPADQSTAALDAKVEVTIQGDRIPYLMQSPGTYVPLEPKIADPGARLGLMVQWNDQRISAQSLVPPPVVLDSVQVRVSETPVLGLLLDSVFIDPFLIDSLGLQALGTGAGEGLVYLVEATLYWTDKTGNNRGNWWIRTQLLPDLGKNQRLSDYFLSPEVLQLEQEIPLNDQGQRSWTGAYAVPVANETDPVPEHKLRASLVRCIQDYADFVAGSTNPAEIEPPTNIVNGRGIFSGLAIDTLIKEIQ